MGSTQQGQAVVEMVLVGGFKKLKRHTHTHTQSFQKKLCLSQPLIKFSESNIFWKGLLLLSVEVDI